MAHLPSNLRSIRGVTVLTLADELVLTTKKYKCKLNTYKYRTPCLHEYVTSKEDWLFSDKSLHGAAIPSCVKPGLKRCKITRKQFSSAVIKVSGLMLLRSLVSFSLPTQLYLSPIQIRINRTLEYRPIYLT